MPDLVGHDRQPSAFLVYLFFWRKTVTAGRPDVAIALQDIAEGTGLAKRTVQSAIRWLMHRRLITVARGSVTSIPTYSVLRPWRR